MLDFNYNLYKGNPKHQPRLPITVPLWQAFGAEISHNHLCQLANAADSMPTLPIDEGSKLLMMRGMTAPNFDPERYSGRWFEVASLKRGFAGQGQEDCHCTQVNLM